MKLYAISGLGADKRVFDYLNLDAEIVSLDWITPEKNETIEKYSMRLAVGINTREEYGIIGVSFGGLVAVEISKKLRPSITILVSSAETKNELRPVFRLIGKLHFIKWLPTGFFKPPKGIVRYLFGAQNKGLLFRILNDTDVAFAKWAVYELMNWSNMEKIKRVLKISGTKDKLIPPAYITTAHLIEAGEHFMIVDRAEEISEIINEKIKQHSNIF